MKKLIYFFIAFIGGAESRSETDLHYEPSIVTLGGTVSLQEFAGPPNYEDVKKGDLPEQYWILSLESPIRVVAAPGDELYSTQDEVREIQLVCSSSCGKRFAFSSGMKVSLTGTLFAAHTGHHHKSVLMTVKRKK